MMQAEILAFTREDNAGGIDNSTLQSKLAKTHVPVGMALVITLSNVKLARFPGFLAGFLD
eukprot:3642527-Rhodomonas_salina.1